MNAQGNPYETGLYGEKIIDSFLESYHWKVIIQRKKLLKASEFRAGEVDRVYSQQQNLLFCEIKTLHASRVNKKNVNILPQTFFRPRQITNLIRFSSKFAKKTLYIRLFIVVLKGESENFENQKKMILSSWTPTFKVCQSTKNWVIFSWAPEIVPRHLRSFSWQSEER
jgi:Holliday junction resolvase-like predicted endonuclease